MMNCHFNRHAKNTVTDNRHLHIYNMQNVGSMTAVYLSVFVGKNVGKNVGCDDISTNIR